MVTFSIQNQYPCYPWTKRLPPCLQPDLDFLAPEYLAPNNQTVTTAADVFSLGVLICWIYSHGKKLIDTNNNLEGYAIIVEQLDVALEMIANELGADLKEHLAKVVSKGVEQRPAVQMLALVCEVFTLGHCVPAQFMTDSATECPW